MFRIRRISTALVSLVLLGATACSSGDGGVQAEAGGQPGGGSPDTLPAGAQIDPVTKNQAAADKLSPTVRQKGELVIAMTEHTPPSGFVGQDGRTVVGVDADMAVLLGQALGVQVKPVGTSFDQIIPGIAAGKYDLTIAAMSPTKQRMEVLDFVDYFRTGTNLATKPGNPKKLTLNTLCGQQIAVLKGSVQEGKIVPGYNEACTKAGQPAIVVNSFPDQQATILALTSGRVDAVVQSAPPVAWAKKQGAPIELGKQDTWTTVALGVKKDSGNLEAIQLATQAVLQSPSCKQVLAKWGVDEHAVSEAKVNNVTY
ncbi:transporter substrate-binding domain-containing protein [Naumannella sp. ID2617S]|nr:transporter substrate-binding domain-containing protein [Naumannella sp. ID2617S]